MKPNGHETIQRYLDGQSSAEEAIALQKALNESAELRALYLDYMNLDMALDTASEAAFIRENGLGKPTMFTRLSLPSSAYPWRWIGTAAACAALVVLAMLPRQSASLRVHPDIDATITSAQSSIARLSLEPSSPLPAWTSPTASLLDPPRMSE